MSRAKDGARSRAAKSKRPAAALGSGVTLLWLSLIVLLPLAAIAAKAFDGGWGGFWRAVANPEARAALEITLWVSFLVALVDVVFGAIIAWVLVRDDFWGKEWVNAIIDLPFALPTIVASIVLLSLYGPTSPIGLKIAATQPALVIALAFVTLPFVVRQVQPVLLELDKDVEEAAASLGAGNRTILAKVIFPSLAPALFTGAGLSFSRAIGEFGSVVLLGGNIPHKTQVASQYIQQQIEIDQPGNAAAVSVVLLVIAFFVLLAFRLMGSKFAWREER